MAAYLHLLRRHTRPATIPFVICLVVLIGTVAIGARLWFAEASTTDATTVKTESAAMTRSFQGAATPSSALADKKHHVSRLSLSPALRWHMKALGDRLEVKGKESITILGTIKRGDNAHATPVRAVIAGGKQLRFESNGAGSIAQPSPITFDRDSKDKVNRHRDEQAIIDTLVFDTAEHFFRAQAQGAALRFLGARFRLDDGTIADYAGPYYDIYQLAEPVDDDSNNSERENERKLYYFNSDTLLLERVRYVRTRDGLQTKVEVQLSDWRKTLDQQVPRRIVRLENGERVLDFRVNSLAFNAAAATPN